MSPEIGGWILAALGLILAFTGTKLSWLAVGIAGFAVGWLFSLLLLPQIEPTAHLLVSLVLGVACALVAIKGLPIIAVALGAVLIGLLGYSLGAQFTQTTADPTGALWAKLLGFVIGAVIGYFIVAKGAAIGISLVTALGGGALVWNGLTQAIIDNGPKLGATWIPVIAGIATALFGFLGQRATAKEKAVEPEGAK
jgi:hypothetical protein